MLWSFWPTFTRARRFAQILRRVTHDTYLHACAEARRAKRAECVLSPSVVRFDQGLGRCNRRAHMYPFVPSLVRFAQRAAIRVWADLATLNPYTFGTEIFSRFFSATLIPLERSGKSSFECERADAAAASSASSAAAASAARRRQRSPLRSPDRRPLIAPPSDPSSSRSPRSLRPLKRCPRRKALPTSAIF